MSSALSLALNGAADAESNNVKQESTNNHSALSELRYPRSDAPSENIRARSQSRSESLGESRGWSDRSVLIPVPHSSTTDVFNSSLSTSTPSSSLRTSNSYLHSQRHGPYSSSPSALSPNFGPSSPPSRQPSSLPRNSISVAKASPRATTPHFPARRRPSGSAVASIETTLYSPVLPHSHGGLPAAALAGFPVPHPSSLTASSVPSDSTFGHSPGNSSGPLNTNSPIALAAAAAVTPTKLAKLLLVQGPLAIRHITSHLAITIPGFSELSLSKQRRLIIAALDAGDPVNGVSFEKVGWGRWAARKQESSGGVHKSTSSASSSYKQSFLSGRDRRESITAHLNSGTFRPPISPLLAAIDANSVSAADAGHVTSTGSRAGVWADDVDLMDDDMMFHNDSGPVRRPRKQRTSMGGMNFAFDDDVFDDEDEDDDDDDEEVTNRLRRTQRQPRHSETDEEDWQSIGAESLRRHSVLSTPSFKAQTPQSPSFLSLEGVPLTSSKQEREREEDAIAALVQLRSV